ncbi:MAG: M17 family metallopeptidase [Parasphingopyxis sp.]
MTDYAALLLPDKGQPAHDLHLVNADGYEEWLKSRPDRERALLAAQKFAGKGYEVAILPGDKPEEWSAVLGVADPESLSSWCLAKAAETLPGGSYRVAGRDPGPAAFGWLTAQYRFDRYKQEPDPSEPRVLLSGEAGRIDSLVAEAAATDLVRTLVNLPAEDMGPAELQQEAEKIAAAGVAAMEVTSGASLEEGYPMIAAVGRAAPKDRRPRLIELHWGNPEHPKIAVVGKGVCFDTGGLDVKSASGMRLMKKDMGGAAHALGLARLIIERQLPVRLHLLVPAVENSISGNALRPGDVIASRKGLSVEIGNTDAEGRLILGDALARACEEKPELVIDFATLTGAARVALGPDLPALFTDNEELAAGMLEAGTAHDDPVWRPPLWEAYDELLKSDIADTDNAASSSMAGATTAGLFLKKFVDPQIAWVHFDTYAWRVTAKPGRPKGGEACGLRAAWHALRARYDDRK